MHLRKTEKAGNPIKRRQHYEIIMKRDSIQTNILCVIIFAICISPEVFAQKPINRINDFGVLRDIAKSNDHKKEDCLAAVRRINILGAKEKVNIGYYLQDIALKANYPEVASAALSLISNQLILTDITLNAVSFDVRLEALNKISETKELIKIALRSGEKQISSSAFNRIKDPDDLVKFTESANCSLKKELDLAEEAINRISDQSLLLTYATSKRYKVCHYIRKIAIFHINDLNAIIKMAMQGSKDATWGGMDKVGFQCAIDRITNQDTLANIAISVNQNGYPPWDEAKIVLQKITDQKALLRIIIAGYHNYDDAIIRISDEKILQDVFEFGIRENLAEHSYESRLFIDYTIKRFGSLNYQKSLQKIVFGNYDLLLRNKAFDILSQSALSELATSAINPIKYSARIRCNQTSWKEIFVKTPARCSSLHDIVGAIELTSKYPPGLKEGIRLASVYIQHGDAACKDDLIKLLDLINDPSIAMLFLNCGDDKLEYAAVSWARGHGFEIAPGSGEESVSWGSGK